MGHGRSYPAIVRSLGTAERIQSEGAVADGIDR